MNNVKSLIPFYLQYADIIDDNNKKECFQFIIFMTNMFYCYIIVLLLVYISFKLKKKIYDYTIMFLFLINYLASNGLTYYFSSESEKVQKFNINLLFGEFFSIKYTHLFINYYFFGFLIGLALFYNNYITHEKTIQNSRMHKPFPILKDIIGFIYLLSFKVNLLILIITIGIQIMLSVIFLICTKMEILERLKFDVTTFDYILYIYEKIIFSFVFGLMIIVFYTFKNESVIKGFFNNMFLKLLNRISYGYYSILEFIINFIYFFTELEVQLNGINVTFTTLGIFFYVILINFVMIVLNEIPIKMLIKKLLHKEGSLEFNL